MNRSKNDKKPLSGEIQLPEQDSYTIGEVARLFDLTPRTLRFYEEMRLLRPRRQRTRRIYSRGDCVRLKLVLRGRRLNFTFDEIREVIELYHTIGNGKTAQTERLLEILRDKRAALNDRVREIELMRGEIRRVEKLCRDALKKNTNSATARRRGKNV